MAQVRIVGIPMAQDITEENLKVLLGCEITMVDKVFSGGRALIIARPSVNDGFEGEPFLLLPEDFVSALEQKGEQRSLGFWRNKLLGFDCVVFPKGCCTKIA